MPKGYDPVLLEHHDANEWISENDDNFVLVLPKKTKHPRKNILLKKSYFLNPQINDLYLQCDIKNDALMLNETNKSKLYRNIGYYYGNYTMIDEKLLIRNLKKKRNMFELKPNQPKSADIVPLDQWDSPEASFINQETLLLTQIGLFKAKEKGNEKKKLDQLFKKNMPYKEEVYFNDLMSKALTNYSWQWDSPINNYLRTGDSYWDTEMFKKYMKRYGNTKELAIKNVKARIEALDKCFMEVAPRNQNDTKIYYRGMKNGYGFSGIGDEVIVRNFGSVSENIAIAYRFSDRIKRCCIHELTIDRGIPLINMVTTTKFKQEKEILLPRDLVFKLVGFRDITIGGQKYSIRKLRVSKMRSDQFKLDTGCSVYPIVEIEPLKNLEKTPVKKVMKKEKLKNVEVPVLQQIPKNVEANLQPAKPAKKPNCPKGSKRDKKSGLCLDKDGNVVINPKDVGNVQGAPKTKKKRCPNGQRRNKTTGLCEPKN